MLKGRKVRCAVLGSSSEREDSAEGRKAAAVGAAVAARHGVLLTGGCPGLPHAAALGASANGGFTVAVSPAMNEREHVSVYGYPLDSDLLICTGMGTKGRNVVLVRSADVCIFIGGGMGTLNEFTIAFDELNNECVIGVLTGTGGLSDELPRLAALVGRRSRALLLTSADPEGLVVSAWRHVAGG